MTGLGAKQPCAIETPKRTSELAWCRGRTRPKRTFRGLFDQSLFLEELLRAGIQGNRHAVECALKGAPQWRITLSKMLVRAVAEVCYRRSHDWICLGSRCQQSSRDTASKTQVRSEERNACALRLPRAFQPWRMSCSALAWPPLSAKRTATLVAAAAEIVSAKR